MCGVYAGGYGLCEESTKSITPCRYETKELIYGTHIGLFADLPSVASAEHVKVWLIRGCVGVEVAIVGVVWTIVAVAPSGVAR